MTELPAATCNTTISDSINMQDNFEENGSAAIYHEYTSFVDEADYFETPCPASPVAALTQANLEAYQAHLRSQAVQPFQQFTVRCPPVSQPQVLFDAESQYSQPEFRWNVCASSLSEVPLVGPPQQEEYQMRWEVTSSAFTLSMSNVLGKRNREEDIEAIDGTKRFCANARTAWPPQRPFGQLEDLSQLFPAGWQDATQTYWDNCQPDPHYMFYRSSGVEFYGLSDQVEPDLVLPEIQECEAWVGTYQPYLEEQGLFQPEFEEPSELALTSPLVETPQRRETPPWRRHTSFANTKQGEFVHSGLPLLQADLNMQIQKTLPQQQPVMYMQEDIVSLKLLGRRLPLALRRRRPVKPLQLLWNAKAADGPMLMPNDFAAQACC